MTSLPATSTPPLVPPADIAGCAHCGSRLAEGAVGAFCCNGCAAVSGALREAGLERFYALRDGRAEPVGDLAASGVDPILVDEVERALAGRREPYRIALSLQGVRCAACVWVLEQLFERLPGALRVEVNVARGELDLWVEPDFPFRKYAEAIAAVGYRVGRRGSRDNAADGGLVLRLGICTALALNAMAFSAAIHLGVEAGPLRSLLSDLSYGAAMLAALVGGPVFFTSAYRALRAGVLHLDLPIALGIALTTVAATWSYFGAHEGAAYFDSLAAFVALMLAGRYLQERTVTRSRAELLDDPGIGELKCRREGPAVLETVACTSITAGDVLLIPPGEIVPVAATLLSDGATCSLAWIDGEAEPRAYALGEHVPAAAINVGEQALRARALEPFRDSALVELLKPSSIEHAATKHLNRFSALYVCAVLALAAIGFAVHALWSGGVVAGLSVATAICVVTCPCALGIAVPLAYELAHVALRRRGIFVRRGSFLDRATAVRQVVFDKTGTLTTGRLQVVNHAALAELPPSARDALYQLCARSIHPKSLAIRAALEPLGPTYDPEVVATERAGLGVEAVLEGRTYRLGRADFAIPESSGWAHTVFSVDGQLLLAIETREVFRPDAAHEARVLRRIGMRVVILSGDAPERVRAAAERLGIDAQNALGWYSPAAKAAWIAAHDPEHTLMVGDGINDAPAMQAALCGATPAIDRPFLPARTDFYFTTPGLSAISTALCAARDVSAIVRGNLGFAIAYNALVVSVALAGAMQPWLAAIVMPLSSVVVVIRTSASVSRRSRRWTSSY